MVSRGKLPSARPAHPCPKRQDVGFRKGVGYAFGIFKVSLLVNNLMNTEYSLRPITIVAPRTTSVQVLVNI